MRSQIDLNSWNFRIWAIAASGFFTGSYNLFATNVVYTSLAFVYFPNEHWPCLVINCFTLLGSILGSLIFGVLADMYGRSNLYGVELCIVVVSTLGLAFCGWGLDAMSFLPLFCFCRFVTGVGLGAECESPFLFIFSEIIFSLGSGIETENIYIYKGEIKDGWALEPLPPRELPPPPRGLPASSRTSSPRDAIPSRPSPLSSLSHSPAESKTSWRHRRRFPARRAAATTARTEDFWASIARRCRVRNTRCVYSRWLCFHYFLSSPEGVRPLGRLTPHRR